MTIQQTRQWFPKKKERQLTTCLVCRKPGYRYFYGRDRTRNYIYTYYVHYNEEPIGITKSGHYKYRRCWANGRIYNGLVEAFEAKKR